MATPHSFLEPQTEIATHNDQDTGSDEHSISVGTQDPAMSLAALRKCREELVLELTWTMQAIISRENYLLVKHEIFSSVQDSSMLN